MNERVDVSMATMLQCAVAHHQAGRLAQAEELYRQILQKAPNHADALHLKGIVFLQRGNLDSAIDLIRRAIGLEPSRANYHLSHGNALQAKGLRDEAIASYRQAILLKPDYPEAHSNLGYVLQTLNRLDESIACHRQALLINPDYIDAHNNLGSALQAQGRFEEAIACYRQVLLIKPDFIDALNNLGAALKAQDRLEEAATCYRQTLLIKPDCAEAYNNLGNALQAQCKLEEAADCYRQALLIKPDSAETYSNLGKAFQIQGKLNEAVASFRQALLIKPDYHDAYSNLIFTLDMKLGTDTSALQAERRRWSEAYADGLYGAPTFTNVLDQERRLRVGYVSADFREHSAAVVFGAMLTRFDPVTFDVFAYSNSVTEDGRTKIFQQSVTGWRKIVGLSDDAVVELIRQDGIDILVDLSGYTAGHRLLVFARKPAPIQITAWGYIGGTGMKAMDVFFADPVVVPPEEKPLYAEEVRYLPNVISACFSSTFPAVNDLPAKGGNITFGSFNRLCKISAEAYQAWAQVLHAIPGSRMLLKTAELDYPGTRDLVLGHFSQAGIDPARVILRGKTTWHEHMEAFSQIDIAIDPFPHGGGVTALEGLMMGVPVVSLRCPSIPGRLSASILTTLGLTDWVAETREQYIALAIQKAQDLAALAELRQQLRPRFKASIIGDTVAYARAVEREYRTLWRAWCLRSGIPAPSNTSSASNVSNASGSIQEAH